MRFFYSTLLFLITVAATTQASAAVGVEAAVAKSTMMLGETNTYTITIRDAANVPSIHPPEVPGLTFSSTPSTQNAMRIINGVTSREFALSWSFRADQTGRHLIPSQQIEIDGERFTINGTAVVVTEMPEEIQSRFRLQWKLPDGPFYVGQTIPATLQLFVRADINAGLGSQPSGADEQFIFSGFEGEPRQRQVQVEGQTYVVVEWDTAITPIRAGTGDLPISLVLIYETGQFQRNIFGTHAVQDQIRLTTRNESWEIIDLPLADRPESFTGAVGNFTVQTTLSRNELSVGEPITLTLEVTGEGNFDRIQAPDLKSTEGWRTYPPRSEMKAGEVSYRGTKTFEYILSPTTDDLTHAPALAFSWFDPDAASWRETEIPGEPVQVMPNPDAAESPHSQAPRVTDNAEDAQDEATSAASEVATLSPMATSPGRERTLLVPWKQRTFWIVNGGLGCLMALSLIGVIRTRNGGQRSRIRSQISQTLRTSANHASDAATRNDAPTFYTEARNALRYLLASRETDTSIPDSLTWNDLEKTLERQSIDEPAVEQIRHLFERKDAIDFAAWHPTPGELAQDHQSFENLLHQLANQNRRT